MTRGPFKIGWGTPRFSIPLHRAVADAVQRLLAQLGGNVRQRGVRLAWLNQPTKRPQLVALDWIYARRPALASPHMQPPGVERADASDHTSSTRAHPLTYDAAACTDHRHDSGATGDKLQIERARIQPHHAQPRKAQVEVKYRAHRLLKHFADQFAHVERDRPMVFDSARSAPANSGHHSRTTAMPAGIRFRFVDD